MDDVNFLRSHCEEVDTEVTIDCTHRPYARFPDPDSYVYELAEPIQNVVDVRLKLCFVPGGGNSPYLHTRCNVLNVRVGDDEASTSTRLLPLRAGTYDYGLPELLYSINDLLRVLDTDEQTVLAVSDTGRVKNVSTDTVLHFGPNHPRLCRALGLSPDAVSTKLAPGEETRYVSFWSRTTLMEYATLFLGDRRFVVPIRGDTAFVPEQNTRRVIAHPRGVLTNLEVRLVDRDGEGMQEMVEGHWLVVQIRHLSLTERRLPTEFRTQLAAQGYLTSGGLYGQTAMVQNECCDDDDDYDDVLY
jgi:hypothetical protein